MPTAAGEIDISELPAWLERVGREIGKPLRIEPWLQQVKLYLVSTAKRGFGAGADPAGRPWRPLKVGRARAKGAGSELPLMDEGLLRASLTANGKGQVDRRTPHSIEFGTNRAFAWVHQEGATIRAKPGKALAIPATPKAKRAGSPRNFPGKLQLVWPKGKKAGYLIEDKRAGHEDASGWKGRRKLKKRTAGTIIHYWLVRQVRVPQRQFLGWTDKMADAVAELLMDEIVKQIRGR